MTKTGAMMLPLLLTAPLLAYGTESEAKLITKQQAEKLMSSEKLPTPESQITDERAIRKNALMTLYLPSRQGTVGQPFKVIVGLSSTPGQRNIPIPDSLGLLLDCGVWYHTEVIVSLPDVKKETLLDWGHGQELYYLFDLARVAALDMPGEYSVCVDTLFDEPDEDRFISPRTFHLDHATDKRGNFWVLPKWKLPPKESDWSEIAGGSEAQSPLQAKAVVRPGWYTKGEPIMVKVLLKCPEVQGHGKKRGVQLFHHVNVWVGRNSWHAENKVVTGTGNTYIKPGETYEYTFDLTKAIQCDAPGEYEISVGYENHVIDDLGDWIGTVLSPFVKCMILTSQ